MNLVPVLAENLRRCRYQKPTPVQKFGIPAVLRGSDLMACAQTGSGKTAAYLIPAVNFIVSNNLNTNMNNGSQAAPSALVLSPTRELSIQIYEEARKFTYRAGIRCVVIYGGADARYQTQELGRGCGLLVATTGRLIDLQGRGYVCFRNIRFLVLDEADRMLDMGFEPQIRQIVQGRDSDMPRPGERQTLLYSATFPKEIQQLAREFLHHHHFLQVGRVGSTTENITQDVRWVEDMHKRDTLLNLLSSCPNDRILVFAEKKRDADYLERFLCQNRLPCTSIHGDRVQRERESALNGFKSGMFNVLVATDVASRGLDIPDVAMVVQYDLPSNIDDYVHRIGRTGRAGKQGVAVSFLTKRMPTLSMTWCHC
ncbi:ATP-dependent RNA helicase [Angomonas deanei]|uniref:Probable eukaryotic initiation factor 4A n=1 Tax=Angomonas deanei TaxID=59799 RepID=A0A7G2C993_9TRYP|nr:ATP-dependent RNA helicase [Angomonas deanei]CAD2216410.1 DEAD/DEAH box helicase/Helicase conserved C-terminal domain containing protein, putative [Angomonas deanei]|eukprot:EPY26047.1 ATP-dependent RNA helicase [Angomonas deanei]